MRLSVPFAPLFPAPVPRSFQQSRRVLPRRPELAPSWRSSESLVSLDNASRRRNAPAHSPSILVPSRHQEGGRCRQDVGPQNDQGNHGVSSCSFTSTSDEIWSRTGLTSPPLFFFVQRRHHPRHGQGSNRTLRRGPDHPARWCRLHRRVRGSHPRRRPGSSHLFARPHFPSLFCLTFPFFTNSTISTSTPSRSPSSADAETSERRFEGSARERP